MLSGATFGRAAGACLMARFWVAAMVLRLFQRKTRINDPFTAVLKVSDYLVHRRSLARLACIYSEGKQALVRRERGQ
jgi:hypothetical protein